MHTQTLAGAFCAWPTKQKNIPAPTPPSLASFEATALPHMDALYRTARHTLGNESAAEDVVQEVFLQAWQSFHRFTPGTNCRAWLFKIMFHVIHNHWRVNKRFAKLSEEEELLFAQLVAAPEIPAELKDEELLAALAQLPENFRAIVLLADVQEFAYKEIAEMLRIPVGTVMSRLSRGRKLLREKLAGTFPAGLATRELALV